MSRGEAGRAGFLQMSINSESRSGTQLQRCLRAGEGRIARPLQPDNGWGLVTPGMRSLFWEGARETPCFRMLFLPSRSFSVNMSHHTFLSESWVCGSWGRRSCWLGAGLNGGCSPMPTLTPLLELPSKDRRHQQQTGPTHSWADVGTRRLSEGWTGRQWQDQEKNTHFGILPWETGNRHNKLNYRLAILSTFWWWG